MAAADNSGILANAGSTAATVAISEGGGLRAPSEPAAAVNSIARDSRPGNCRYAARPLNRAARSEPRCFFRQQHFHHRRGRRALHCRWRGGRYRFRRGRFRLGQFRIQHRRGRDQGRQRCHQCQRDGAVGLTATDQSKITAAAGSVALGVAGGEGGGVGLAVGVSVASNDIGTAATPNTVEAFIDNSSVTGDSGVDLTTRTSAAKIWVPTIAPGRRRARAAKAVGGIAFGRCRAPVQATPFMTTSRRSSRAAVKSLRRVAT